MMDMCCGGEVKGEGYILNLIYIFFFYDFWKNRKVRKMKKRIFSLAARIYKKEFSNLHPSPFYLRFCVSNSYG